jgi:hypothetical protein
LQFLSFKAAKSTLAERLDALKRQARAPRPDGLAAALR